MSDQHVCYDCERDFAAVCRKCSDDKVAALRAQLAAVEKDRDELVAALKLSRELLDDSVATENSAVVRVKALEAALEPTVEGRRKYVSALMYAGWFEETADAIVAMDELLHAIRARAGLTKEGK